MDNNIIPENVKNIIGILHQHKYEAYLIGGAVRNLLFNKESTDFDITTNATPEQIKEIFGNTVTCGNSFLVSLINGVEVATYRKDKTEHAEVAKTLYEDVIRRDFTINAIVLDGYRGSITLVDTPNFIDHVGGIDDIYNRILRFIGEPQKRIDEDPVRILRGLRFASQYNLEIEKETYFAMYANRHLLSEIPGERIQLEVIKAFKHSNTHRFLTLLKELEMLYEVFPTLCSINGLDGGPHHNEMVLNHCLNSVKAIDNIKNYKLKLACLYHDIGKNAYFFNEDGDILFHNHHKEGQDCIEFDLSKTLKFDNKTVDYVKFMARHHMDSLDSKKSIRRLFGRLSEYNVPLKDFIYLRYADKKGNIKNTTGVLFKDMQTKYRQCLKILNEKPPFSVRDLNVTGCKVMEYCNLTQGPEVGIMLNRAFDAVIEEKIENNEQDILSYLESV